MSLVETMTDDGTVSSKQNICMGRSTSDLATLESEEDLFSDAVRPTEAYLSRILSTANNCNVKTKVPSHEDV
jgi:hypothetical protein